MSYFMKIMMEAKRGYVRGTAKVIQSIVYFLTVGLTQRGQLEIEIIVDLNSCSCENQYLGFIRNHQGPDEVLARRLLTVV